MKRDIAYWKYIRASMGWRGVFYCLNCVYGPPRWKRLCVGWWRLRKFKRMYDRMTPEAQAKTIALLRDLAS